MQVHVPGKLVLLGEYAVLDGAPALCLAVDSGVSCAVTAGDFRITTPDGDDRFARAALDAVGAPPAHYAFGAWRPLDLPGKPGLGGSAAAVVAGLLAGGGPRDDLVETGIAVHRAVQGSGSGIDVATSATGGVVRFQGGRVTAASAPEPLVVYSGTSAKTGPRVQRYRDWTQRDAFVRRTEALVDGFTAAPLEVVREAWRLLVDMADQAGFAYRTPGIDRIVALAEAAGGAAKPSGAGGGDVVVCWAPDRQGLAATLEAEGFAVLDVHEAPAPVILP